MSGQADPPEAITLEGHDVKLSGVYTRLRYKVNDRPAWKNHGVGTVLQWTNGPRFKSVQHGWVIAADFADSSFFLARQVGETALPSSSGVQWYVLDQHKQEWVLWQVIVKHEILHDAIASETFHAHGRIAQLKAEGNEQCRLQNWHKALAKYSEAIELIDNSIQCCEQVHLDRMNLFNEIICNKALCNIKLQDWKAAETDAGICLQQNRNLKNHILVKASYRHALACEKLCMYSAARMSVLQALDNWNTMTCGSRSDAEKLLQRSTAALHAGAEATRLVPLEDKDDHRCIGFFLESGKSAEHFHADRLDASNMKDVLNRERDQNHGRYSMDPKIYEEIHAAVEALESVEALAAFLLNAMLQRDSVKLMICSNFAEVKVATKGSQLHREVLLQSKGLADILNLLKENDLRAAECAVRVLLLAGLLKDCKSIEHIVRAWNGEGFLGSLLLLLSSNDDIHKWAGICALSELCLSFNTRWWTQIKKQKGFELIIGIFRHPFLAAMTTRKRDAIERAGHVLLRLCMDKESCVLLARHLVQQSLVTELFRLLQEYSGAKDFWVDVRAVSFLTHDTGPVSSGTVTVFLLIICELTRYIDISVEFERAEPWPLLKALEVHCDQTVAALASNVLHAFPQYAPGDDVTIRQGRSKMQHGAVRKVWGDTRYDVEVTVSGQPCIVTVCREHISHGHQIKSTVIPRPGVDPQCTVLANRLFAALHPQRCSNHGCTQQEMPDAPFQKCAGCHLVRYCSKNCQSLHWSSEHKQDCKCLRGWFNRK